MKAIVYDNYGPPDVLQFKEVEKPAPRDDEVLIRVHATTVTTGDVNLRGFTFVPPGFGPLPRLMFGLRKPKRGILGVELAGKIEAVGGNVKSFREGDPVFGINSTELGAYAEFVCWPEKRALAIKPDNLTYAEAAAIPFGGGTALYFLQNLGKIQKGQRILINGASGSVGSAAVQLASHFGAEVTGVCSTANLQLVTSLGAHKVIDYTRENFRTGSETYDLILDTVPGKTSFSECKSSLNQNGVYLAVAGGLKEMAQTGWNSRRGGKRVLSGSPPERKEELIFLRELAEAGKFKAVVDRRYPLEQTSEAHRYVDQGHKKGNVVIIVNETGI